MFEHGISLDKRLSNILQNILLVSYKDLEILTIEKKDRKELLENISNLLNKMVERLSQYGVI